MLIRSVWILAVVPFLGGALFLAAKRRGWSWERLVFVGMFTGYALAVSAVTLFPIPVEYLLSPQFSEVPIRDWVELRPFTISFQPTILRVQTLPNVALMIPFGFGAWFVLSRTTWRKVLGLGVIAALAIELLQLAISLLLVGFPYRVIDVSDFIFNSAGVGIGIACYFGFAAIWRAFDQGSAQSGLFGHIRTVVSSATLQ